MDDLVKQCMTATRRCSRASMPTGRGGRWTRGSSGAHAASRGPARTRRPSVPWLAELNAAATAGDWATVAAESRLKEGATRRRAAEPGDHPASRHALPQRRCRGGPGPGPLAAVLPTALSSATPSAAVGGEAAGRGDRPYPVMLRQAAPRPREESRDRAAVLRNASSGTRWGRRSRRSTIAATGPPPSGPVSRRDGDEGGRVSGHRRGHAADARLDLTVPVHVGDRRAWRCGGRGPGRRRRPRT